MRDLGNVGFCLLLLAASVLLGPPLVARELDFETRVAAQEAIERVYHLHRTGTTRSFDEAVPRDVLERKVRTYLAQSVALEQYWKSPVTPDALRLELERMAQQTRMPSLLRELFAALNDDSLWIQECLVRPILVNRLARRFFDADVRIHAGPRGRAESLRRELAGGRLDSFATHPARKVTTLIRQTDSNDASVASSGTNERSRVLAPDAYDRLRTQLPSESGEVSKVEVETTGYIVRVVLEEDSDRVMIAEYRFPKGTWEEWWSSAGLEFSGEPGFVAADNDLELPPIVDQGTESCAGDVWDNGVLDDLPDRRAGHSAVWTGTEMILWGGKTVGDFLTWTGLRYQPATDSWAAVSTVDAPPPRWSHRAIWTGELMIVWGGAIFPSPVNTGGRYDPVTDSWTPTAIEGAPGSDPAPIPRVGFTLTWTGDRMLVWGGYGENGYLDSGGSYDPATDLWDRMTPIGAPQARSDHTAVWTGDGMIVWGGQASGAERLNSGGIYDPTEDSWTATSSGNAPSGRMRHTAVWIGDDMIVWGGEGDGGDSLASGGRYDPRSNSWASTSMIGAPAAREFHSSVAADGEMIVWGGSDYLPGTFNDGARYQPHADMWLPMAQAPMAHTGHSAVWANGEMIVWNWGDGARYVPASDSWALTKATHAPTRRSLHSAVWTGAEMIVWGGKYTVFCGDCFYDEDLRTGGVYRPATDSWTPTSMVDPPVARTEHAAVWTGNEMIIWGGDQEIGGQLDTGARYDPITSQWTAMSTVGAPMARDRFTAVWNGSEMLVWGGRFGVGATGGRYDPVLDTWAPISTINAPISRYDHTAVWTGSEMIVWGGRRLVNFPWDPTDTGARYDPSTDTWTATSTQQAPEPRYWHTAVWTGEEMIVWAGENSDHDAVETGARYDPVQDTWIPTSTDGTPGIRHLHTAIWTGNEMVVWGGTNAPAVNIAGGRYDPHYDTWAPASEIDSPDLRVGHSAIWTGDGMIVWDGAENATGGIYDPDGIDQDGDGFGCLLDCDDTAGGLWRPAEQVSGLRFAASKVTLEWEAVASESGADTVYDVVRGDGGLPVGSSVEVCLEADYPPGGGTGTIELDDEALPEAGSFFWYLVRPTNGCGVGTYGSASSGAPRPSTVCD